MATPFRLKRSAIEGKRPGLTDLQLGELALNTYDGYLYTERDGVGVTTVTNLTPWYENYGGGSIYYSNSVGIGTTVPQYNLDVRKGSIGGYDTLVAQHSDTIKEIAVTVATKTNDHRYQGQGSSQGYVLDGIEAPILTLTPGRTYKFNLDVSDMSGHPFRFYLDEGKTVQYTTNVTTTSTSAQITITDDTPNILHYQCSSHGYMGNALIVNSNVINSPYAAIIRNGLDVLSGNVDISSNLNVTGNLDVDGDTTLDVTTIDGLLDINAGGQANTFKVEDLTSGRVVIAGTGGELEDSGNLVFNGTDLSTASLIVSDLTDGRVVITGGSGAVEDSANLKFNSTTSEFEVVGHTILDTVNTSGMTTIGKGSSGGVELYNQNVLRFKTQTWGQQTHGIIQNFGDLETVKFDSTSTRSLIFKNDSGGLRNVLEIGHTGSNSFITGNVGNINLNAPNVAISTNVSIGGTLTVFGNVSIGGTLTYEDVARVDAVGLSTFREGIFLPDNQKAQFGNAAGSADLEIYHDGNQSIIADVGTGQLAIRGGTTVSISNPGGTSVMANFIAGGAVNLFYNGTNRLKTTPTGVDISGTLNVTGISTFNDNVRIIDDKSLLIGNHADGDLSLVHDGNNSVIRNRTGNLYISNASHTGILVNGTTGAVNLSFGGNLKFETTNTGITVTGDVTASNFLGNATTATDLAINGTNQLLYQASNNDSAILPTGNPGQILQSNGSGSAPQWVTSAPAGAIEGISIREESTIVGSANSISTINFVGESVTADAAVEAGIATVTINAISGILVKEGGTNVGTAITAFDFAGSLVDVDAVSNTGIATVQIDGLSINDEGSSVGTAGSITTLNFVGAGIVADAAANAGIATITVSGGASTDDIVALAIALG